MGPTCIFQQLYLISGLYTHIVRFWLDIKIPVFHLNLSYFKTIKINILHLVWIQPSLSKDGEIIFIFFWVFVYIYEMLNHTIYIYIHTHTQKLKKISLHVFLNLITSLLNSWELDQYFNNS